MRRQPPMDMEGGSITLVTTLTKAPYPRQYAKFFQRKATLYLSQGHFLKQQKAVLKKLSMMTSKTGKQVQSKRVMMINSKFIGVQYTISKINDWMRQLIQTKMLYLCLLSSQGIVSGCCWVFQTITFIAFSVTSILQKIRQLQVKIRERPVKIQPSITKPSQRTMIGRRVVIKPAWINERRRAFCRSMLSFRMRLVLRSVQNKISVIHRGEIESMNPIKNSPIAVQNLDINIINVLASYKQTLVYENQGQIKMELCLIAFFGKDCFQLYIR